MPIRTYTSPVGKMVKARSGRVSGYASTFNDYGKGVSGGFSVEVGGKKYGVAGSIGTKGVTGRAYKQDTSTTPRSVKTNWSKARGLIGKATRSAIDRKRYGL